MRGKLCFAMSVLAFCAIAQARTEIFVSPNGSDTSGDGSAQKPFAGFARAADAVLNGAAGEYKISLAAGNYGFEKSAVFKKDKMAGKKLAIEGEFSDGKRVRFVGGKTVSASELKKVTDASVLAKLPAEREGELYFLDLKKFGMTDYGKITRRGWGYNEGPFEMEAFLNFSPLSPAGYPNSKSLLPIGEVFDNGTITHDVMGLNKIEPDPNPRGGVFVCDDIRASRWATAPDAWIEGKLSAGWAYEFNAVEKIDPEKRVITLKYPSIYGVWSNYPKEADKDKGYAVRADLSTRGYHIFNLIEEADADGEYYIDRKDGVFYIMLKNPPSEGDMLSFSAFSAPIIVFENVSDVKISNVEFTVSRDAGFVANNCERFDISNCKFTCCRIAADIKGNNINIDSSTVCFNAAGGIILEGGNADTLEPANSKVSNSEFFKNTVRKKGNTFALKLYGVGTSVANSYFHDNVGATVVYNGSKISVEGCVFERCCQDTSDMGVVYGGGISGCHDVVISGNFFSENLVPKGAICGVYVDEGARGVTAKNNIFCRTGSKGKSSSFGAMYIHGGADNYAIENVFINCDSGFSCQTWTDERYAAKLKKKEGDAELKARMHSEVYMKSYPTMEKVLNHLSLRVNYAFSNKVFFTPMSLNGLLDLRGNTNLKPDEAFCASELVGKKDWTLADVEKYFGGDELVKKILSKPIGIIKK